MSIVSTVLSFHHSKITTMLKFLKKRQVENGQYIISITDAIFSHVPLAKADNKEKKRRFYGQ